MTATDFDLVYELYLEQFGHTFSSFLLDDDTRELATLEMLRSLSGERDAITDEDLDNIGEGIREPDTADYGVVRDKLGRFASKHGTGAAEAAVSWKVGKVVGGAVGAIAAQHGFNPDLSRVVGESVVQAFTATALHASKGNREPKDLAQKFLSEAAAAFAGKTLPGFDDAIAGGDDDVKEIVATFAGRALNSPRATKFMAKHGKRLKSALSRQSAPSFAEHDLTRDELESLWALVIAAMLLR